MIISSDFDRLASLLLCELHVCVVCKCVIMSVAFVCLWQSFVVCLAYYSLRNSVIFPLKRALLKPEVCTFMGSDDIRDLTIMIYKYLKYYHLCAAKIIWRYVCWHLSHGKCISYFLRPYSLIGYVQLPSNLFFTDIHIYAFLVSES